MMNAMNVDPVLERYGPPATVPLPPWLVEARGAVTAAADELRRIDDEELARRWRRDDPHGDTEVRYVFYRALEAFERAAGLADRDVGAAGFRSAGNRPFALATIARWDLHGLLTSLEDGDLDADPGGGEWTVRQTLAHTVNVQRAYPSFSAWWLSRDGGGELPAQVPDDVGEGFPEETDEGAGSLGEIRNRLDAAMDGAAERLAILDDSQLATPARWSGFAVDVGFRLGRMSSHLQEHTVQVEKTLAMLGHEYRETDRLIRLVLRAYGRLESAVFAVPRELCDASRLHVQEAIGEVTDEVAHVRRPVSVTTPDGP